MISKIGRAYADFWRIQGWFIIGFPNLPSPWHLEPLHRCCTELGVQGSPTLRGGWTTSGSMPGSQGLQQHLDIRTGCHSRLMFQKLSETPWVLRLHYLGSTKSLTSPIHESIAHPVSCNGQSLLCSGSLCPGGGCRWALGITWFFLKMGSAPQKIDGLYVCHHFHHEHCHFNKARGAIFRHQIHISSQAAGWSLLYIEHGPVLHWKINLESNSDRIHPNVVPNRKHWEQKTIGSSAFHISQGRRDVFLPDSGMIQKSRKTVEDRKHVKAKAQSLRTSPVLDSCQSEGFFWPIRFAS